MLNLSLQRQYFQAIKAGLKTAEGRPYSLKFKDLHPGDTISFTCIETGEVIYCTVRAIHVYTTFYEMLHNQGVEKMLPGITTIQDGVAVYEAFPLYKEKVLSAGAIAIEVTLSSKPLF